MWIDLREWVLVYVVYVPSRGWHLCICVCVLVVVVRHEVSIMVENLVN